MSRLTHKKNMVFWHQLYLTQSCSPQYLVEETLLMMPHDFMLRENMSLALLCVLNWTGYYGSPLNQRNTHLPGLVWGTWGLGVVLGLGRRRRGLCDALVAKERKALCYSTLYGSGYWGEVFPKPVRVFKVPWICSLKFLLILCQCIFFF